MKKDLKYFVAKSCWKLRIHVHVLLEPEDTTRKLRSYIVTLNYIIYIV